jgi:ABC-2 type transport system permease protein
MLQARGVRQPAVPIIVEPRVWYNPELESSHFLVPGLIGYLLMLAATVATSLSVVREKERGTLEQIVVSPVRPAEFILGKTLPYLFVSIVTSALIIGAAMLLFGMPLRGNVGWLFVSVIVFLLGSLGIGLWVSTIADTQQVALQISLLITLLPAMLLSGMIFPIASMPKALRWITLVVPPRHFIVIMRSIILKGTGPEAWANELAILAVFAVAILTIASVRMRKRSAA